MGRLRVNEIFLSLQGETKTVGLPTVFIRLTGCPLRCHYCDTAYAFNDGNWMTLKAILEQVQQYKVNHVTVTGGEPLMQPTCNTLLTALCNLNYTVSLETSGALDISGVDTRVSCVVDIKTPGSGEVEKNLYTNIDELTPKDQIKMVLCDQLDYEWAKSKINHYDLISKCEVLLSPVTNSLPPVELAEWIIADRLPVRFQIQLHKLLWGDQRGH